MRSRIALLILGCAVLALAAQAPGATGRVVDSAGQGIAGAEVCAIVGGGAPGLCARSRDDGSYDLPATGSGSVRIVASGYLPRTVDDVARRRPVALERAAALRIRIVDRATGKPPATAEVDVVYSTGRKLGPFPANASGLSLPTLPAGDARIVARSPRFKEASSDVVRLEAGRQADAVVALEASGEPSANGK